MAQFHSQPSPSSSSCPASRSSKCCFREPAVPVYTATSRPRFARLRAAAAVAAVAAGAVAYGGSVAAPTVVLPGGARPRLPGSDNKRYYSVDRDDPSRRSGGAASAGRRGGGSSDYSGWKPTEERKEVWRPPLFRPADPDVLRRVRRAEANKIREEALRVAMERRSRPAPAAKVVSKPRREASPKASVDTFRRSEQVEEPSQPMESLQSSEKWEADAAKVFDEAEDAIGLPAVDEDQLQLAKLEEIDIEPTALDSAAAPAKATPVGVWPKLNLYQLTRDELEEWVTEELRLPPKRATQLWRSMYENGARSLDEVKGFSKQLRRDFARVATLGSPDWSILAERESNDGTLKRAYGVPGGHAIESVLMPYDDGRRTACISSQVGCAMGCVFCATGQMGFKRHLTGAEIFEQAARFSSICRSNGERLSSVVLLGMGEPLANYANVLQAVHRINKDLGIGMRHITLSTVGLVPAIIRLADEQLQLTLAISLHAATDEERNSLLPVNLRYPIESLMAAARYYKETTGRRVSFEWTLIHGKNDDVASARKLGALISNGAPGSHVNLIPLNPTKGYSGGPTQRAASKKFVDELAVFGVEATVRVRRGIDIDAGCGQLAERSSAEYANQEHVEELIGA